MIDRQVSRPMKSASCSGPIGWWAPSRMALSIAVDRADALMERVDRLVDHRQQDAVDDEAGEILREHRRVLPSCATKPCAAAKVVVVGGDAADQLDQLHDRNRVHEVDADEALRPVGGEAASRVIEIDEVLVASIASGFSVPPRRAKISRLTASFSVAASMTRSLSASPS